VKEEGGESLETWKNVEVGKMRNEMMMMLKFYRKH